MPQAEVGGKRGYYLLVLGSQGEQGFRSKSRAIQPEWKLCVQGWLAGVVVSVREAGPCDQGRSGLRLLVPRTYR
jgi:hypothetical protein